MAHRIQDSVLWRRTRIEILERDNYRCQIRGPRCKGTATEADHIIPVADGGAPYDPANLRASCKTCNIARANTQKHREGWRRGKARIILVIGPPGSGKAAWVAERAGPADLVVDYDAISQALGPRQGYGDSRGRHSVVTAARNAMLREIRRGEVDAHTIYILSANPDAESMFPYHEIVNVAPDREDALALCGADRPASFVPLVGDWYARREGAQSNDREW